MENPCKNCNEFPCSWDCVEKNKYDKKAAKTPCPFCGAIPSRVFNGILQIQHKKSCFLSDKIQSIMSCRMWSMENEQKVIDAWNTRV